MRYYFKLSASHSRPSLRRFPAAAALVLASAALAAEPLTTAFTYQGHLQNVSGPASGPQAMVFQLYDAASGGNPVGPALVFDGQGGNPPPVVVADGLFTASLDFGAGVFDGQRRCLQVTVAEEPQSPRQELTAAPYALHALNGPGQADVLWSANGANIRKQALPSSSRPRARKVVSNGWPDPRSETLLPVLLPFQLPAPTLEGEVGW